MQVSTDSVEKIHDGKDALNAHDGLKLRQTHDSVDSKLLTRFLRWKRRLGKEAPLCSSIPDVIRSIICLHGYESLVVFEVIIWGGG